MYLLDHFSFNVAKKSYHAEHLELRLQLVICGRHPLRCHTLLIKTFKLSHTMSNSVFIYCPTFIMVKKITPRTSITCFSKTIRVIVCVLSVGYLVQVEYKQQSYVFW